MKTIMVLALISGALYQPRYSCGEARSISARVAAHDWIGTLPPDLAYCKRVKR
jgi:hypothetical protein